jgi:hypothetical protein
MIVPTEPNASRTYADGVGGRRERAWQRATAPARRLPHVVIIGAQRCGTTSLFDWLSQSPAARPSRVKEIHYFDNQQHRSHWWYRSHFPLRPGGVVFEATPSLLYLPDVPRRFATLLPQARAVAVLRDPVARAVSSYWHVVGYGREHRSLPEAVWSAPSSIEDAYKERGRYAEQLERWFDALGRDRVSVVFFEEVTADPQRVVGPLARSLGFGELTIDATHRNRQEYEAAELPGLREYFADGDAALERLLGRSLPWRTDG